MREFRSNEIETVSGGNPTGGAVLSLASAYYTGYKFGEGINVFNQARFKMSFGEALNYTLN